MTGVANSGSATVSLSATDNSASYARYRVSCSNNIFYDISDADLTFVSTLGPGFNPFMTTGSTTFFNTPGLTFAASAGNCGAGSGGGSSIRSGGGGSFAYNRNFNETLWLGFLSVLIFGVLSKRVFFTRFRLTASRRPE